MNNHRYAISCLIYILSLAATYFIYSSICIYAGLPSESVLIISGLGTFTFTSIIYSIARIISLKKYYNIIHELGTEKDSNNSTRRKDFQKLFLHGKLTAKDPVKALLSGHNSIFVRYNIKRVTEDPSTGVKTTEYLYYGDILVPSTIISNGEPIRILGFPDTSSFMTTEQTSQFEQLEKATQERIIDFVKDTNFTKQDFVKAIPKVYREQLTENDGRMSFHNTTLDTKTLDLSNCIITECHIKSDRNAIVVGTWSAKENGIISSLSADMVQIFTGSRSTILKKYKKMIASFSKPLPFLIVFNLFIDFFPLFLAIIQLKSSL